jgi:hypothetical protein
MDHNVIWPSHSGSFGQAKYFMENDISRCLFDDLLERMAPIIIERRLARGDTMQQVEDLLMLFCWSTPKEAIASRRQTCPILSKRQAPRLRS